MLINDIAYKAGTITIEEMAAKELRQVEKMIKKGEIETAAKKYIEVGGNPGGITKTVNSYLRKNPNVDAEPFNKFRQEVVKLKTKTDPSKKRTYIKSKVVGTTKSGEKVIETGQSQPQIKKKNLLRLEKEAKKSQEELDILQKGTEAEKERMAKEILGDWGYSTSKVPKLDDEPARILWNYGYKKGEIDKVQAIIIMKKTIEKGRESLGAMETLSQSKTPAIPTTTEREKELKKRYKKIEDKKMKENVSKDLRYYEQMLVEGYNYTGSMFWENYILSGIVKSFPEYVIEYGEEEAKEMFIEIYGEKTRPLFDYMIENESLLFEAAIVSGKGLLFEEVGARNMEKYLTEIDSGILKHFGTRGPVGMGFSTMLKKARSMTKAKLPSVRGLAGSSTPLKALTEPRGKILGFLGGLWNKLKSLGKGVFDKVAPFVKSGFSWAKNLVKQGVSFIANNPIARIAVPAVLLAGGAVAAVKLINKLRKKSNKKPMNKKEIEALNSITEKNKAKIETYRKKAKIAA